MGGNPKTLDLSDDERDLIRTRLSLLLREAGGHWFGPRHVNVAAGKLTTSRLMWAISHDEPLPAEWYVTSTCGVPGCVHPSHLTAEPAGAVARKSPLIQANIAKTRCPHGHAYDAANTLVLPDGKRRCRTCDRGRVRRLRQAGAEAT